MRKGITPIISTIVLLLITVALAGAAWIYMSGFLNIQMEKSFIIQPGGAYCDVAGFIHVKVVNTGTSAIIPTDDFGVVRAVSGTPGAVTPIILVASGTIPQKNLGEYKNISTNSTGKPYGTSGASYEVVLSTVSGSQRATFTCP